MTKRGLSIQVKILCLMLSVIILITSILIFIFIKEEENFLLSLRIPPATAETFLQRISQKLSLTLSIIIIFLLGVLSILIKRILSPILKLSLETRTIAGGDLDYPISIETEDEIGEIAKDFKVLEKSLKATIKDLRRRNREIDALFKAVTAMTSKLKREEILKLIREYLTSFLGYDYILISSILKDKNAAITCMFSEEKEIKQAIEDIIGKPILNNTIPLSALPFKELVERGIIVKKDLKEIMGDIIEKSACDAIQMLIGAKTFIIVSLLIKGELSYILLISSSKEKITEADKTTLSIFIHHASLALENAQLHEEKEELIDKLEKTVEERTKELEVAYKKISHQEKMAALGTMAGRIGHELKNPLAIIKSNVYYLKKKVPKEFLKYLEMIGRAEERATVVVNETMSFVKGVSLKMDLSDINHIIDEVLKGLSHEIAKVDVIKELSEKIPLIPLDSHWIHNLFVNLVFNALQAIEGEGIFHEGAEKMGKIKIKSTFSDNHIEVSISDSGPGIPENIRDKIFEPFFGTKTRGTGLGLAISKEIVSKHRGTISISDSELGGACFTVRFPIER